MIQMKRMTSPYASALSPKRPDSQRRRRSAPDRMRVGSRRTARPFAVPETFRDRDVEDGLPSTFYAGQIDLLDVDFDEGCFDDQTLLTRGGSRFPGRHHGADPEGGDLW